MFSSVRAKEPADRVFPLLSLLLASESLREAWSDLVAVTAAVEVGVPVRMGAAATDRKAWDEAHRKDREAILLLKSWLRKWCGSTKGKLSL